MELIESKLTEPLHWKKPSRVFVNSMSDLFHENLSDEQIARVFRVICECRGRHTFQILTKRASRLPKWFAWAQDHEPGWFSPKTGLLDLWNVHLGVSIEDPPTADQRIPELLKTPAAVRFVSYEPALEEIYWRWASWIDYTRVPGKSINEYDGIRALDWAIIGGESGPHARPFSIRTLRNTIRQFKAAGVPLFVKQMGARPVGESESDLLWISQMKDRKGSDTEEWPEEFRVREFPR